MRVRDPKMWQPIGEEERKLAVALRDYCFTGHRLPFLQWLFVKTMCARAIDGGRITDKQGEYIRKMAGSLADGGGTFVYLKGEGK